MTEHAVSGWDRTATILRLYRMLDMMDPTWYQPSAYVAHALCDLPTDVGVMEGLADIVERLLDDRRGSLDRLNREDIVYALAQIRQIAAE